MRWRVVFLVYETAMAHGLIPFGWVKSDWWLASALAVRKKPVGESKHTVDVPARRSSYLVQIHWQFEACLAPQALEDALILCVGKGRFFLDTRTPDCMFDVGKERAMEHLFFPPEAEHLAFRRYN